MGGYPKILHTDTEGALNANVVQDCFKEHDIFHIVTLSHSVFAERMIRTFKNMVYKRIGKSEKPWYEFIYPILLTYNNLMIHNTIKMSPNDARKESNKLKVKMNLELHAKHTRSYPPLAVGDSVKVYKKKDKLDKERVSSWSENRYEILDIQEHNRQLFYKVAGRDKLLMRAELLKV